jgi:hypothetical protein
LRYKNVQIAGMNSSHNHALAYFLNKPRYPGIDELFDIILLLSFLLLLLLILWVTIRRRYRWLAGQVNIYPASVLFGRILQT